MKKILIVVSLTLLATIARSQKVERITPDDVKEAEAHPQCAGGKLKADNTAMPESSSDDIRIASYMRQFREYRAKGNNQQKKTIMIHINGEQTKSDAFIRDVTPSYFHIETTGPGNNTYYCFIYTQITQVNYDDNRTLHISVNR
jgi:hypothetical protein